MQPNPTSGEYRALKIFSGLKRAWAGLHPATRIAGLLTTGTLGLSQVVASGYGPSVWGFPFPSYFYGILVPKHLSLNLILCLCALLFVCVPVEWIFGRRLPRLRFRLSTCVIVMLSAAFMLYGNVVETYRLDSELAMRGWPMTVDFYFGARPQFPLYMPSLEFFNAVICLELLAYLAFVLEFIAGKRYLDLYRGTRIALFVTLGLVLAVNIVPRNIPWEVSYPNWPAWGTAFGWPWLVVVYPYGIELSDHADFDYVFLSYNLAHWFVLATSVPFLWEWFARHRARTIEKKEEISRAETKKLSL